MDMGGVSPRPDEGRYAEIQTTVCVWVLNALTNKVLMTRDPKKILFQSEDVKWILLLTSS